MSFRQGTSKTADALHIALKDTKKLLLTATPIIGNVIDVWGLLNFIDDNAFGSSDDFYKRYYKKPENYAELKEVSQPYIFRTLRRLVKADVMLPERLIHTQQYALNKNELEIYSALEKYLIRPNKITFPLMDAYELNLMIYKLFSSSIYALSKTLEGVLERLYLKSTNDASAEAVEIKAINLPAASKGSALHQTLESLKQKGLPQKVVVFTENHATKEYILSIIKNTQYNAIDFKSAADVEAFKDKNLTCLLQPT